MNFRLLIFYLFIFLKASTQGPLTLTVLDLNSNPIPYCSVTWNRMSGLVTNLQGQVTIEDVNQIKDSIVINALAYKTKVLYPYEVAGKANINIVLEENYIRLPEIKITNKQLLNIYGCTDKKEGYSYITNLNNSTLQTAFLISNVPPNSILEECRVFISKKSDDKIPFRIRIYQNNNGLPGNDLIRENIIITDYQPGKWKSINLDSLYLIAPDNGLFIAVEWLITNDLKNYRLGIGQTDSFESENTFVKWGNIDWQKFSRPSPINKQPTNIMIQAKLSTF